MASALSLFRGFRPLFRGFRLQAEGLSVPEPINLRMKAVERIGPPLEVLIIVVNAGSPERGARLPAVVAGVGGYGGNEGTDGTETEA